MFYYMFAIYDQCAGAYLLPFFLPNEQLAVRTFSDCVQDPEHQFNKHPEHYTLFKLGSFDMNKGSIVSINPVSLGKGIEFVNLVTNLEQDSTDNIVEVVK